MSDGAEFSIKLAITLGAVVLVLFVVAQGHEQKVEQDIAQESKAVPQPARIYSRRCLERGMDWVAMSADGGRWVVRCVKPVRL